MREFFIARLRDYFLPRLFDRRWSAQVRKTRRATSFSRSTSRECGWGRNRTADTRIFSPLLCQLSYPAESRCHYRNASRGGCSLKQKTLNPQRRVATGAHRAPLHTSSARRSLALPEKFYRKLRFKLTARSRSAKYSAREISTA